MTSSVSQFLSHWDFVDPGMCSCFIRGTAYNLCLKTLFISWAWRMKCVCHRFKPPCLDIKGRPVHGLREACAPKVLGSSCTRPVLTLFWRTLFLGRSCRWIWCASLTSGPTTTPATWSPLLQFPSGVWTSQPATSLSRCGPLCHVAACLTDR